MAGAKLLVVDDEPSLLNLMGRFLTKAGYEVTMCSSGDQAWGEFSAAPDDFAVVISDLSLPGLPGEELVNRIRERRPGQRLIVCSGSLPADMESGESPLFLQKPFLPKALLVAVSSALAGEAAATDQ